LITLTIFAEEYKLWSFSLQFSPASSPSFLIGQNILLHTLFSNAVNPCSISWLAERITSFSRRTLPHWVSKKELRLD
jgi:hypothetical protein